MESGEGRIEGGTEPGVDVFAETDDADADAPLVTRGTQKPPRDASFCVHAQPRQLRGGRGCWPPLAGPARRRARGAGAPRGRRRGGVRAQGALRGGHLWRGELPGAVREAGRRPSRRSVALSCTSRGAVATPSSSPTSTPSPPPRAFPARRTPGFIGAERGGDPGDQRVRAAAQLPRHQGRPPARTCWRATRRRWRVCRRRLALGSFGETRGYAEDDGTNATERRTGTPRLSISRTGRISTGVARRGRGKLVVPRWRRPAGSAGFRGGAADSEVRRALGAGAPTRLAFQCHIHVPPSTRAAGRRGVSPAEESGEGRAAVAARWVVSRRRRRRCLAGTSPEGAYFTHPDIDSNMLKSHDASDPRMLVRPWAWLTAIGSAR